MKTTKSVLSAFMLASAFSFVSCADDAQLADFNTEAQEVANVTFSTTLPTELISRAAEGNDTNTGLTSSIFGDGTKATTLYYAVYATENGLNKLVLTNYGKEGDTAYKANNVTFTNLNASFTVQLPVGQEYKFAFWAQSQNASCYTFNPATADITIDYTKGLTNDDNLDAFFASATMTVASAYANQTQSVTLTRPFAQLNVGVTDYADAKAVGFEVAKTNLSVMYINSVLNLLSGEASTPVLNGALEYNATPAQQGVGGVFPAKENGEYVDAEYIAMAYILTSGSTYDVQLNYTSNTGVVKSYGIYNVPLTRNKRTNVYGSLLTGAQQLNVTINNSFVGDDNQPGFVFTDYNF
jgi:hypothetical protein